MNLDSRTLWDLAHLIRDQYGSQDISGLSKNSLIRRDVEMAILISSHLCDLIPIDDWDMFVAEHGDSDDS